MIKKQLGLLAGSVMVASSANAAIRLGRMRLAVFNTRVLVLTTSTWFLRVIIGSRHWLSR